MSLSRQEKMAVLLKQLDLPEEIVHESFKDSELQKVVVYKEKKHGTFI